jgi:primosomal replication protein N
MNSTVLDGKIVSRDVIRQTPGGIATLNLKLLHQSTQTENGHDVQVEVEMNAVAFGALATEMDSLKVDDAVSLKGFLSRKNRFSTQVFLHITQFKI